MPHDITPAESLRLHQDAERLARQLRRKALRDFPDAATRALACAAVASVRAAVPAAVRGLQGLLSRTEPSSPPP